MSTEDKASVDQDVLNGSGSKADALRISSRSQALADDDLCPSVPSHNAHNARLGATPMAVNDYQTLGTPSLDLSKSSYGADSLSREFTDNSGANNDLKSAGEQLFVEIRCDSKERPLYQNVQTFFSGHPSIELVSPNIAPYTHL